jgi:hypothetical protein
MNSDDVNEQFLDCCRRNDLTRAKFLYYFVGGVDLGYVAKVGNKQTNITFPNLCYEYGHIEFIKWLYSIGCKGRTVIGFRLSCSRGDIESAQWYLEHSEGDIKSGDFNSCFYTCCSRGKMNMLIWLFARMRSHYVSVSADFYYDCFTTA